MLIFLPIFHIFQKVVALEVLDLAFERLSDVSEHSTAWNLALTLLLLI